jgi:predicted nucleotide-binding protein
MTKSKYYQRVFFRPEHLSKIGAEFKMRVDSAERDKLKLLMKVSLPTENWEHQSEAEFFSDIRKDGASYQYRLLHGPFDLIVDCNNEKAWVVVSAGTREAIEAVFHSIETLTSEAQLPVSPSDARANKEMPVIFIGHGRDTQWRDLKDHLHEQHGFAVQAYEIGARAGHAIRDVLEEMLTSSSIAFLVMTGEDETVDGKQRARQNVIHETGLFQGRLGFARAIVLLEDGVEEFSNIHGIQQIRFSKGGIRETFGDVLATIRREFPDGMAEP